MVQDVNVSNLFFAERPESNLIQKRNSENGDDSYEAVAKQKTAEVKKSGKESTVTGDTTSPAPRTVKTKVDKPKVGNKDAFFPERQMPIHPTVTQESKPLPNKAEMLSEPVVQVAPKVAPENQEESVLTPEQVEAIRAMIQQKQESGEELRIEDVSGVLNQSYQSAQVSYPVSQIAAQSLDDETKRTLVQQGLWDIQGQYLAQPSPKLLKMMDMSAQSDVGPSMPALPTPKPIAQFMASMENELGVAPDRLVQAYGKMAPEDLTASPQQTMAKVIDSLDLNAVDSKRAEQLYSKMLVQLQQSENSSSPMNLETIKGAKKLENAAAASLVSLPVLETQTSQVAVPTAPMESGAQQNQSDQFSRGQKSKSVAPESLIKAPAVRDFEQQVKSESLTKVDVPTSSLVNSLPASSLSAQGFESLAIGGAGAAGSSNLVGGADAKQEAIQSIINNAQALSQKGGGEMKLTLRPDHLGEIQLKVSTNGTGVDVQMIAERSEAKRLIEQNISELKHGLAQHNLSMDKIDVFIGDRGAQFQNHQNKPDFQQAREFAQQFQNGHAQYRQKDSDEQGGGRARIAKPQPEKFRSMLPARRLDQGRLNVVA